METTSQGLGHLMMEDLDGGVLDAPVHPLGLIVGPGVIGLGQPVLDAMLVAGAISDVAHAVPLG